jgi:threonine/homoserine/homoserine lactone efflux protein
MEGRAETVVVPGCVVVVVLIHVGAHCLRRWRRWLSHALAAGGGVVFRWGAWNRIRAGLRASLSGSG